MVNQKKKTCEYCNRRTFDNQAIIEYRYKTSRPIYVCYTHFLMLARERGVLPEQPYG